MIRTSTARLGRLTSAVPRAQLGLGSLRRIPSTRSAVIPIRSFSSTSASHASASPSTSYLEPTHTLSRSDLSAESEELLALGEEYLLGVYARPDIVLSHGKGSWVWDLEGRKYLDFCAGIAVNALGHGDEGMAEVLKDQAGKILHASNVYHNAWSPRLASLLVSLTRKEGGLGFAPGTTSSSPGAKVFFANSGTEANEGALKIARRLARARDSDSTSKTFLVCFENAFHGRTMGALSVTPNAKYQAPFRPLVGNVRVGRVNEVEALQELIKDDTCGVIVEPIQGEGGVNVIETEWLRALRKRCDEVGATLIYDEVQCGLYRTGTLWAHSKLPVDCHPDIVTMAKPLAGGYPVGAVMAKDEVAKPMGPGAHGTTFGGSPLACALGHYVLSRVSDPAFTAHIADISAYLQSRLERLPGWFPNTLQPKVRGRGLMRGLGFWNDGKKEEMKERVAPGKVAELARARGLLVLTAGNDAVRLVPSLNVGKEEVDFAVDVLESSLSVAEKEAR